MSSATDDEEIDEISQKIISTIERTSSKELGDSDEIIRILHLTDAVHAKTLLEHGDEAPTQPERDVRKKAIIKALLVSTWQQRLYFIVRSFIMGLLSGLVTIIVILYFGSINFRLQVVSGMLTFVFSLAVSRLFDVQIVKVTKKIVDVLRYHNSLRNFILDHF